MVAKLVKMLKKFDFSNSVLVLENQAKLFINDI